MLLRLWQTVRCFFALLFWGDVDRKKQKDDFRKELVQARMRYRASNARLSKTLGDLLSNLEYDRIVHNDGVVPLDRKYK